MPQIRPLPKESYILKFFYVMNVVWDQNAVKLKLAVQPLSVSRNRYPAHRSTYLSRPPDAAVSESSESYVEELYLQSKKRDNIHVVECAWRTK